MPIATKLAQLVGMMGKLEASYGVAETLDPAQDGFYLYLGDGDPPNPSEIQYVFDGGIGRAPGNLVNQPRVAPAGANRPFEFTVLGRGTGGTAYSASVTPPNEIHRSLQAAGFVAAFSAAPTPQWTYTPAAAGVISALTARLFAHGSRWDGTGVVLDLEIVSEGLGVPTWRFVAQSVAPPPADEALPVITYAQSAVLPPVAQGVTLELGTLTAPVIKSARLALRRATDKPRIAQNLAGGHAGFTPGMMVPTLTAVIEAPARSSWDPDDLRRSAANVPVVWGVGATPYNRWRWSMANAQIVNVANTAVNDVACVEVTIEGHGSTPSANDAIVGLFN